MADEIRAKDVVRYVRRRGLDWLFQTMAKHGTTKAVYVKPHGRRFEVDVIKVERLKWKDKFPPSKATRWIYLRSLLITSFPLRKREDLNDLPDAGDKILLGGRVFLVVDTFDYISWLYRFPGRTPQMERCDFIGWHDGDRDRFVCGMRVFVKDITDQTSEHH